MPKKNKVVINTSLINKNNHKKINNAYNNLAFISQSLIPMIDDLKESTEPKFEMKKAINDFLRECEKLTLKHYKNFENYGDVKDSDSGNSHHSLDIYNITASAYDYILSLSANEVVGLVEIHKSLIEKGLDIKDVPIKYNSVNA